MYSSISTLLNPTAPASTSLVSLSPMVKCTPADMCLQASKFCRITQCCGRRQRMIHQENRNTPYISFLSCIVCSQPHRSRTPASPQVAVSDEFSVNDASLHPCGANPSTCHDAVHTTSLPQGLTRTVPSRTSEATEGIRCSITRERGARISSPGIPGARGILPVRLVPASSLTASAGPCAHLEAHPEGSRCADGNAIMSRTGVDSAGTALYCMCADVRGRRQCCPPASFVLQNWDPRTIAAGWLTAPCVLQLLDTHVSHINPLPGAR